MAYICAKCLLWAFAGNGWKNV